MSSILFIPVVMVVMSLTVMGLCAAVGLLHARWREQRRAERDELAWRHASAAQQAPVHEPTIVDAGRARQRELIMMERQRSIEMHPSHGPLPVMNEALAQVAACPRCGGVLRPRVDAAGQPAEVACGTCHRIWVVGPSLVVQFED